MGAVTAKERGHCQNCAKAKGRWQGETSQLVPSSKLQSPNTSPHCKPERKDPWVMESTEATLLRAQNRAEMGENGFGWLTTSPN